MAFGDIGGPLSGLIITCKTPDTGTVAIHGGDAVKLTGPYEITNVFEEGDRIFGQAMEDCTRNGAALSVRVRGICDFPYAGDAPVVDGVSGVVGSEEAGKVAASSEGAAFGMIVKVNSGAGTVETLL